MKKQDVLLASVSVMILIGSATGVAAGTFENRLLHAGSGTIIAGLMAAMFWVVVRAIKLVSGLKIDTQAYYVAAIVLGLTFSAVIPKMAAAVEPLNFGDGNVIKCTNSLTLSSKAGVQEGFNGYNLYTYDPTKGICNVNENRKGSCFSRYKDIIESGGVLVGFERSKNYPMDSQVIFLDLPNQSFHKTVVQGSLRYTAFGHCEQFDSNVSNSPGVQIVLYFGKRKFPIHTLADVSDMSIEECQAVLPGIGKIIEERLLDSSGEFDGDKMTAIKCEVK